MEMETPMMLLFICNGTNQGSIKSDTKKMLKTALDDIKVKRMMPKAFKKRDTPHYTLKFNAPRVPSKSKQTYNKA
jgi:hypothetical protein